MPLRSLKKPVIRLSSGEICAGTTHVMMKKTTILFILFFLGAVPFFAQAPNWQWLRGAVASGNVGNEGYSIATDAAGNVIIAGWFKSPVITFGTVSLTNNGMSDIFITKYDAAGNVLWAKSTGGSQNDRAYSVTTDLAGNVFVAGCFYSPTMIVGTDTLVDNSADDDIFLAKYDANGNPLWARRAGAAGEDRAHCVTTDGNGDVAIGGRFNSPSITIGTSVLVNNNGLYDLFLAKYDASGNPLWAKSFGGNNNESAYGITSQSGHLFLTGEFDSPSIVFGTSTLISNGIGDIFLTAFDGGGNTLWAKNTGGTSLECGNGVAIDAVGSLYVAGYFYSPTVTFGTTTLVNAVNTAATTDACLFKYDSTGNPLWAKRGGGAFSEFGYAVAVDPKSNVYFTGNLVSFPDTFDTAILTAPVGSVDPMFIVSYDSSGVLLCGQALASGGDDNNAVAAFAAGEAFIGGDYIANPFYVGSDSLLLTSSEDVFLARFDCNGTNGIPGVQSESRQLRIFPNPSNGKSVIENPFPGTEMELVICNALGQPVLSEKIPAQKSEVDFSALANGLYILRIKAGDVSFMQKIIVQH